MEVEDSSGQVSKVTIPVRLDYDVPVLSGAWVTYPMPGLARFTVTASDWGSGVASVAVALGFGGEPDAIDFKAPFVLDLPVNRAVRDFTVTVTDGAGFTTVGYYDSEAPWCVPTPSLKTPTQATSVSDYLDIHATVGFAFQNYPEFCSGLGGEVWAAEVLVASFSCPWTGKYSAFGELKDFRWFPPYLKRSYQLRAVGRGSNGMWEASNPVPVQVDLPPRITIRDCPAQGSCRLLDAGSHSLLPSTLGVQAEDDGSLVLLTRLFVNGAQVASANSGTLEYEWPSPASPGSFSVQVQASTALGQTVSTSRTLVVACDQDGDGLLNVRCGGHDCNDLEPGTGTDSNCEGLACGTDDCGTDCGACFGGRVCLSGRCCDDAGGQVCRHLGPSSLIWLTVPGGTFPMGCSLEDQSCLANESPTHQVTLPAFELTEGKITMGQYEAVLPGSVTVNQNNKDLPMEKVSWIKAAAFCQFVGGRLPTEAELEYATRAGSRHAFPCGPKVSCLDGMQILFKDSATAKLRNAFGLLDLTLIPSDWGAAEWVADWYSANYYASSPELSPQGPTSGTLKVYRKGGRSSARQTLVPTQSAVSLGFRCARDLEATPQP